MIRIAKSKLLDMLKVDDLLIEDYKKPLIITEIWEGKDDENFTKNGFWAYGIEDKSFFYNNSILHGAMEYALNDVNEIYRRNDKSHYEIFAYRKNKVWYVKEE